MVPSTLHKEGGTKEKFSTRTGQLIDLAKYISVVGYHSCVVRIFAWYKHLVSRPLCLLRYLLFFSKILIVIGLDIPVEKFSLFGGLFTIFLLESFKC